MQDSWSARADAAEEAVVSRHLRRLWALPGTTLGVVAWPAVRRERLFLSWHYWWQAHLLDCAVDALERDPTPRRRRRIVKLARSHRLRNISGWTNNYYDDMAWLGIALERAQRMHFIDNRSAVQALESQLFDAWAPEAGGGIPWRKGSNFYNAPANGPAGIMLARTGKLWRAQATADWIDDTLRDVHTNLIADGIHPGGEIEKNIYSYCQGVVLGLETELAVRLGSPRHRNRTHRLVDAIDEHLAPHGVIDGGGGGDGGLFNGILARYLALTAVMLPWESPADIRAREIAAQLVLTSAESAWENRLQIEGQPLFGHDWTRQAQLPGMGGGIATFTGGTVRSSGIPERDMSVQLGGWMLMEAAHMVSAAGYPRR
ncbi:fructose-bisphosphate aldolase [Rhodococcus sp. ACS1]|uniref:Predicted alpha-1,6-mannanase, GH76 family n=1 Tax=Rhodococcus koreensis TaxID=99653 RepID=A0A1H4QVI6_9NOCA|nr:MULTISPECIES: glycoside hydrolase family 76 protein [Rhodococcus]PBC51018.1 fructose-bisphosphate aldolase [Rhodococcus sp. ACS1]SEC23663.1 Predicted alpha-1,6-mannanase, GH76 family [Rhodococcus koreensis]